MAHNQGFLDILDEIKEIHDKKKHDYGGDKDPLANFRLCENIGVSAWHGAEVRLCDKISRIWGFMERGILLVEDEKIEDTLMDRAVYSILALQLYREHRTANETPGREDQGTVS